MSIDDKKSYIIFIINMLYQYINDNDKELFLTYIPSIIFAFHANYTKSIGKNIQNLINGKKTEDIISVLKKTLIEIPKFIPKYEMHDYSRKESVYVDTFLFVSLYNAIITDYSKNFVVNFLWFERNIGFYQYYFTGDEYSKIINQISCPMNTDLSVKIDISIPTALYLNFKDSISDDSENLWQNLDVILYNNSSGDEIKDMLEEIFVDIGTIQNRILEYSDVINYFNSNSKDDFNPFINRFMIYAIQTLYYYELLTKDGFIKNNKYFYTLHCDKISDDYFELEDVNFNLWYTSDCFDSELLNIINIMDNYYAVSPMPNKDFSNKPDFKLNDSIIYITNADSIKVKGNQIGRRMAMLLSLKNVNFYKLNVSNLKENYDEIINNFTSKDIVETFGKANRVKSQKIYAFLGLNYFTNIEDFPKGRENIIALYINGLMEYQNYFPIRGKCDKDALIKDLKKYIKDLRPCCATIL